jgi:hypothetical protein
MAFLIEPVFTILTRPVMKKENYRNFGLDFEWEEGSMIEAA